VSKSGFYKSFRHKAHRWSSLSARERGIFFRAFILLLLVTTGLKTIGFRRTQAWLGLKTSGAFAASAERTRAEVWRTADLVRAARKWHIVRSTCLSCSLVLWRLLLRQGIDSDVRIGVRRGMSGEVEAHAWIEWNGEVLNDCADIAAHYVPFSGTISTGLTFD
jgi:Transglutaminase-like superfamily